MGNRLSKIYTRTGDDGSTGLGDGSRVAKESLRVEAYGSVDEANSAIGVVLATPALPPEIRRCLTEVQRRGLSCRACRLPPGGTALLVAGARRKHRTGRAHLPESAVGSFVRARQGAGPRRRWRRGDLAPQPGAVRGLRNQATLALRC
jgi:hypothetical protein